MSDDLQFLQGRVPGYSGYADPELRHDSDERIRAFVGERVNALRERIATQLDSASLAALDALIFRCQFADQSFIHRLDKDHFNEADTDALVATDRELVETAGQVESADAATYAPLVAKLDAIFSRRHEPVSAL
jgi:hypothetical protein